MAEPTGLPRLPPGRHGLPREFVTRNQRERLAAGTIAAVAKRGYHEATITDIAAGAGVSRRTFYTYFSSKEECFAETYEMIAAHFRAVREEAATGETEWPRLVRVRIDAMLETFAANPDLVRFCLIAAPSAGGEIAARYRDLVEAWLRAITGDVPEEEIVESPSEAQEQAIIGGVFSLITRMVRAGEGENLLDLGPDLTELVLALYIGRDNAAQLVRGGLEPGSNGHRAD